MAKWDAGKLTVFASTQGVSNARTDIAKDFGLPLSKVRVVCKYMGGGFGNKNQAQDYDYMAAVLAKVTSQPVKLEFTREDDYIGMHGRWASEQQYKIGVKKDGTITAVQLDAVTNMGAYRKQSGNLSGTDFYQIPNFKKVIKPVHTNTVVAANYRAPAYPQSVFGFASFLDQIAFELGINPVDMFHENRIQKYKSKIPFTSNYLKSASSKDRSASAGTKNGTNPAPWPVKKHGIGMALGGYPFRPGLGAATIRVNPDGTAHVLVGVTDIGTGAKSTMAIIAAEALGIPLNQIQLTNGDTDVTPYSVGESGSRTTAFTGPAVIAAAEDVRKQIFAIAAGQLKVKPEELDLRDGQVFVKSDPAQKIPLERERLQESGELIGRATTNPSFKDVEGKSFAAHFAEVEVDTWTGHVKITRYVAAHDSGTIINRLPGGSQIKGGVVQGIGMAFTEELHH